MAMMNLNFSDSISSFYHITKLVAMKAEYLKYCTVFISTIKTLIPK